MNDGSKIYFFKGSTNILDDKKMVADADRIELIKKEILQIFDVKNLSFLLGAGCSSFEKEVGKKKIQIGIPVMNNLASEFYTNEINTADKAYIKDTLKIDIENEPFKKNLEKLLETLYSYRFLLERQNLAKPLIEADNFIKKITKFLLRKCINEENNKKFTDVVNLYKLFYKKLIYRDNNLSKTNIFTTNYDLYSETSLDELGILYSNGFSGVVQRYFNPTVFNYAYAEQMELSNNKWNVIDNFVYLYKLHGSINWIESDSQTHLFKVKEIQDPKEEMDAVMIYPTPMKQMASFASPYSDLFREFQKKLMQDKNILITIGYSFSDEHINNLVYQALTIPNFRLVIFQNKDKVSIEKIVSLNDPRIWVIGGFDESTPIHYFDYVINKLLPDINQEKIEKSIEKVLETFFKSK